MLAARCIHCNKYKLLNKYKYEKRCHPRGNYSLRFGHCRDCITLNRLKRYIGVQKRQKNKMKLLIAAFHYVK